MNNDAPTGGYIRPYVPGAVTTKGYIVICVPGMPAVEVTEPLAKKLTDLIVARKISEAQTLLTWFGAGEGANAK